MAAMPAQAGRLLLGKEFRGRGQFLAEQDPGFDAEPYDLSYLDEAPKRMW